MSRRHLSTAVLPLALLAAAVAQQPLDWLVTPRERLPGTNATVTGTEIILSNSLIERRFVFKPAFACTSFKSLLGAGPPTEILRVVGPEALLTLDGVQYNIGGLLPAQDCAKAACTVESCPDAACRGIFTDDATQGALVENASAWRFESYYFSGIQKLYEWTPGTRSAPSDVQWPPNGVSLHVNFSAPDSAPAAHKALFVTVHYEIYQGAPVMAKWVTVGARDGAALKPPYPAVSALTVEWLSVTQPFSNQGLLWVEKDIPHGVSVNWQDDPRMHNDQAPGAFEPIMSVSYDQTYSSDSGYHFEVELDPRLPGTEGGVLNSFRVLELALDSTDRERTGLAVRRVRRLLAPAVQENPIFMHLTVTDEQGVNNALDQMAKVGFEMAIFSFGSGFNVESTDPQYIATIKAQIAQAQKVGKIEVGGYDLIAWTRNPPNASWQEIAPPADKPDGNACFASAWKDYLLAAVDRFVNETGLSAVETDGPYFGFPCASTTHEYHKGLHDSIFRQTVLQAEFYRALKARGVYIHQPDDYFFYGASKTAMGYDEDQYNLPRWEDLYVSRAGMFDDTYLKPVTEGWMFVPLVDYHGGGDAAAFSPMSEHQVAFEWALAQYFGYGVMPCWRGPVLYDSTWAYVTVKKWVDFYKQYRDILTSDIVHLRRPDNRGVDAVLHVNSRLHTKGLAVVFNPTGEQQNVSLPINLYYTGLTEDAQVSQEGATAQQMKLARDYSVVLPLRMAPRSITWFTFQDVPHVEQIV